MCCVLTIVPLALDAQSISLMTVLVDVAARHPAILAARSRVAGAYGDRSTAGSLENPQLAYQVENTSFPGASPLIGIDREAMSTLMIPLSPLYQRAPRIRQADALARAATATAFTVRQSILLATARAYLSVALATVTSESADSVTRMLDSVVVYNRTRVQQGIAAESELLRTELERDRAAADASMSAAELARTRAELTRFVDVASTTTRIGAFSVSDQPLRLPSAADAISTRTEVVAAQEQQRAAQAGVSVEDRSRVRDLVATIGVKQMAGRSSMVAGFALPLPLFDQNRGRVERARAERDIADFDVALERRAAAADLAGSDSVARILTGRVVQLASRDASGRQSAFLARADESRAITLGAYREGAATLLQLLDAVRAWSDARITFYRTLYAQHDAVLTLLVARGNDIISALPALIPSPSTSPSR